MGYPRDRGATDFCDSARLAGMMIIAEWGLFEIPFYFDDDDRLVRSPQSNIIGDRCREWRTFSRDQLIPLLAGYYLRNREDLLYIIKNNIARNGSLCPNGDWLSPSQKGHLERCIGNEPSWLQEKWLYLDIMFSAYVQPMAEPNQLIAMLVVAGPKWVRLWKKHNKDWKEAIRFYWGGWRKEGEFADQLVLKLEVM